MANEAITAVLNKYLPEGTSELCTEWIVKLNIHLKITKNRYSRFGDYRPVKNGQAHVITVNHNLNRFAFLITFIHEVAHLMIEKKYGIQNVKSHGREWKQEYASLLKYFLTKNIFPSEIAGALRKYIHSPAASSCTNAELMRALKKHDDDPTIHVEELPEGTLFKLFGEGSDLTFKKGKKARTRYHCLEIRSGRSYMVSGIAEALVISPSAH